MSKEIEHKLNKIPVLNILVKFGKKIKIPGLEGMSLYDVLEMYIIGIVEGALTTRAGGIAYSFFMAIFPFYSNLNTLHTYRRFSRRFILFYQRCFTTSNL